MCERTFCNPRQGDMPLEDFIFIVNRMPDLTEVGLQGLGEPLLHPQLWQMCRYVKNRDIRVSFNTNASLLSMEAVNTIFELKIDEIRLSYDSINKDNFEKIRKGLDFDQVTRNIIQFCRQKQKKGKNNRVPKIVITIVGMRENFKEIPGIVDFAIEHSIDKIELLNLYVINRGLATHENSLIHLERERVSNLIDNIYNKCKKNKVEFLAPILDREKTLERVLSCSWPREGIYITWDGHITPCCVLSSPTDFSLGNVFKEDISVIWHSKEYREFRRSFSGRRPPIPCIPCLESRHILESFLEVDKNEKRNPQG
jgi:radical SAM protein with 4Fe4S-binding SPASM domain